MKLIASLIKYMSYKLSLVHVSLMHLQTCSYCYRVDTVNEIYRLAIVML
ncbi:hypothetical protein CCP3SC1AL1_240038 [Gammaproteobacteria bacterium]